MTYNGENLRHLVNMEIREGEPLPPHLEYARRAQQERAQFLTTHQTLTDFSLAMGVSREIAQRVAARQRRLVMHEGRYYVAPQPITEDQVR